jgi:hypothetical protein
LNATLRKNAQAGIVAQIERANARDVSSERQDRSADRTSASCDLPRNPARLWGEIALTPACRRIVLVNRLNAALYRANLFQMLVYSGAIRPADLNIQMRTVVADCIEDTGVCCANT